MLPTWYPALVALHLIFMVTFFASTFCLLRLFIVHRGALAAWEPERTILTKHSLSMGKTLLYIVAWPSLILMVVFGAWMIWLSPALLVQPWIQAKLGLTALLVAYHMVNQRTYAKFRTGEKVWSTNALRIWTQGSVFLLFVLVFLSAFRQVQWYIGVLGLLLLSLLLFATIRTLGRNESERKHAETGKRGA